jgi:hypothetical protein
LRHPDACSWWRAQLNVQPPQGAIMNLIRILFLGLAVLLPTTWTIAKAGDEAPSTEETKTTKKTKKSKKSDGSEKTETEKKTETKTEK